MSQSTGVPVNKGSSTFVFILNLIPILFCESARGSLNESCSLIVIALLIIKHTWKGAIGMKHALRHYEISCSAAKLFFRVHLPSPSGCSRTDDWCFLTPAGNQRHGDPGAYPQRTGPYDGDPADLPHVAGQQQPLHEAQPQDLLTAVRPTGGIPAEPGGKVTSRGSFACFSPELRGINWKFEPLMCWTDHITHHIFTDWSFT